MLLQLTGTTFDFRLSTFDFPYRWRSCLFHQKISEKFSRFFARIRSILYRFTALKQHGRRLLCLCYGCTLCGVALCGLLCGSVAAFYGVGVLCIGYGVKIALRGKYGRSTGCGFSRLCCACGLYAAVGVSRLWVYSCMGKGLRRLYGACVAFCGVCALCAAVRRFTGFLCVGCIPVPCTAFCGSVGGCGAVAA